MNIIESFEKEKMNSMYKEGKPVFSVGDTLEVSTEFYEGEKKRSQLFKGVCIAIKNRGLGSSFIVRKISYGEGVEKRFPLYSPLIDIKVSRQGDVRQSKLYYLRSLSGKKARIPEKKFFPNKTKEKSTDIKEVKETTVKKNNS